MTSARATALALFHFTKNCERQGTADEEKERFIMALTREYIRRLAKESDVELPKEFIDGIISEHTTARDAYAEEQVKTALENNKSEPQQVNVKESQEYKDLEKQFNDYKTAQTEKETKQVKEKAFVAFAQECGISDRCNSGRKFNAFQLGTTVKGIIANGRNSIRVSITSDCGVIG